MTLYFCTGSYAVAATTAGRRLFSCNNFWTTFRISFISGSYNDHDLYITLLDFGRFLVRPWPEFTRSNMEFVLSQLKMVLLSRNKGKHIDWNLGSKCDHRIWLWPWPWPLTFKVESGICYNSAKHGPITKKWKANLPIELWMCPLDLTMALNFQGQIWNSQ